MISSVRCWISIRARQMRRAASESPPHHSCSKRTSPGIFCSLVWAGSEDYDPYSIQRPSTAAATNRFGLQGPGSTSAASGGAGVVGLAQVTAWSGSATFRVEISVEWDRRIMINQIIRNTSWKAAMVIIQPPMRAVALISPMQDKMTDK